MAILYTPQQMKKALQDLRIQPVDGNITTKEVAKILSWRSEQEFNTKHDYPETAVRRRTQKGHIKTAPESTLGRSLYRVEEAFKLDLYPKRGLAQKKLEEAA